MSTSRREFLTHTAGLSALVAFGAHPQDKPPAAPTAPKPPAFRISLAEWSYHQALQKGEMEHRDFAKTAKQVHQIEAIELVNSFFKDKALDAAYLKELKSRADDFGVKILLIMCDGEGDLAHSDPNQREKAVENHRKWLAAARALGCHSIRVNAHGSGSRGEQMSQMAESLHALGDLAKAGNLNVIVENHGGLSSDGAWLAGVMKKANHPLVGTLPDFGNFKLEDGTEYDRYKGVLELMPWARAVSAKCYDFGDKGDETTIDFRKMMKVVLDAGYHGHVGIEYEGARMSEKDGIDAMKRLLEKVRGELA